jgi:hypothetical protein
MLKKPLTIQNHLPGFKLRLCALFLALHKAEQGYGILPMYNIYPDYYGSIHLPL